MSENILGLYAEGLLKNNLGSPVTAFLGHTPIFPEAFTHGSQNKKM